MKICLNADLLSKYPSLFYGITVMEIRKEICAYSLPLSRLDLGHNEYIKASDYYSQKKQSFLQF